MISPDHLLAQARQLLRAEATGRPRQASLRRACSTAYYALFHAIINDSCRVLIGGQPRRKALRAVVARCFNHADMREVCRGFAAGSPSQSLLPALTRPGVDPRLRLVAVAFGELQAKRHQGDYDRLAEFARPDVEQLIDSAERAIARWRACVADDDTQVFVAALLLNKQMRG